MTKGKNRTEDSAAAQPQKPMSQSDAPATDAPVDDTPAQEVPQNPKKRKPHNADLKLEEHERPAKKKSRKYVRRCLLRIPLQYHKLWIAKNKFEPAKEFKYAMKSALKAANVSEKTFKKSFFSYKLQVTGEQFVNDCYEAGIGQPVIDYRKRVLFVKKVMQFGSSAEGEQEVLQEAENGHRQMEGESLRGHTTTSFKRMGTRVLLFNNELEYNSYFRVGQPFRNQTPCVSVESVDPEIPIVFEEWQLKKTRRNQLGEAHIAEYVCRRSRMCRNTKGFVGSDRKRKLPARGYIGCNCTAKYTVYHTHETKFPAKVVFKGTHNHDVQMGMLNFINPIRCCRVIREMVDRMLSSSGAKATHIAHTVRTKMRELRENDESFEHIRAFQVSMVLKPDHISNRIRQLGLKLNSKKAENGVAGQERETSNVQKRKVRTPATHIPKAKIRTTLPEETECANHLQAESSTSTAGALSTTRTLPRTYARLIVDALSEIPENARGNWGRSQQAIEDYIRSKYPGCAFVRDDLKSAMQMCIRANLIQPVNKYKVMFRLAPKPEAAIRSRSVEGVALVHSCSDLLKMPDTGCEQRGQIQSQPQPPTVAYDWAFDMGAKASSILATENFVYAGDESGLVVKLARKDGKHLLQSRLSAGVKCMVVEDEFIFAGTSDGCVYDLSLFERPRLVVKVEDVSQLLCLDVYKGKMAASDSKGQVLMLDYEGETIWKRRSSGIEGCMVRMDDTGVYHGHQHGVTKYDFEGKEVWSCRTHGVLSGWQDGSSIYAALHDPASFDEDIAKRLRRAGARSGEVVASLMWDSTDDLDLYAVTPGGETIYYDNKRSSCNGRLDVAMSTGCAHPSEPVENIFWENAPAGHYKIMVHQCCNRSGQAVVPFEVHLKIRDTTQRFKLEWTREWEAEMSREQQERREKWEQDPVRVNALANHQAKSKAVDEAREAMRVAEAEGKGIEETGRRLALAVNAMEEASEIKRKAFERSLEMNTSRNFLVVHEFDLGERPEPLHKAGVVQITKDSGAVEACFTAGSSVPAAACSTEGALIFCGISHGAMKCFSNVGGRPKEEWVLATGHGSPTALQYHQAAAAAQNRLFGVCGTHVVSMDVGADAAERAKKGEAVAGKSIGRDVSMLEATPETAASLQSISEAEAATSGGIIVSCVRQGKSKLRIRAEPGQEGVDESRNIQVHLR